MRSRVPCRHATPGSAGSERAVRTPCHGRCGGTLACPWRGSRPERMQARVLGGGDPEPVEVEFEVEARPARRTRTSRCPARPPGPCRRRCRLGRSRAACRPPRRRRRSSRRLRARPVTPIDHVDRDVGEGRVLDATHAVGRVGIDVDRHARAVAPLDRDRVGRLRRDGPDGSVARHAHGDRGDLVVARRPCPDTRTVPPSFTSASEPVPWPYW